MPTMAWLVSRTCLNPACAAASSRIPTTGNVRPLAWMNAANWRGISMLFVDEQGIDRAHASRWPCALGATSPKAAVQARRQRQASTENSPSRHHLRLTSWRVLSPGSSSLRRCEVGGYQRQIGVADLRLAERGHERDAMPDHQRYVIGAQVGPLFQNCWRRRPGISAAERCCQGRPRCRDNRRTICRRSPGPPPAQGLPKWRNAPRGVSTAARNPPSATAQVATVSPRLSRKAFISPLQLDRSGFVATPNTCRPQRAMLAGAGEQDRCTNRA